MTALLEALRRIETQRPARAATPSATATTVATATTHATAAPAAKPAAVEKPKLHVAGELPLNARATVADDVAAAANAIVARFRAPSLVALVTTSDASADLALIDSMGAAIEAQGFRTSVFGTGENDDPTVAYGLSALQELRASGGYHLLHVTAETAMEQTRMLAAADGVVMLVELQRTSIQDAETIVGMLRRECVAVSGIVLIA